MFSDLPLVDQAWMFSLVIAFIVGCLLFLVLMGPAFVRDVYDIFSVDGPTTDPDDDSRVTRFTDRLNDEARRIRARDREIQELQ